MIILRKKLFSTSNPKSTEQILLDDKTFTQSLKHYQGRRDVGI